jgi:hypothetical protein
MKSILFLSFIILFFISSASADDYLGDYSSNPYNPNSISNPYGAGSQFNPSGVAVNLIQVALIIRMAPMAVPTATNQ